MSKLSRALVAAGTFSKIGLFTFGGGYAMLSLIEDICVERKKWITRDEMMNITVVAESTPGPIAINCSTYVGYKQAGLLGACFATLGMVLPSFLIIYVISVGLDDFLQLTIVAHAFQGIKAAVGLLVVRAGISMLRQTPRRVLPLLIVSVSCIVMLLINLLAWNFSSISLLLIAAALTLAVRFITQRRAVKERDGV